MKRIQSIIIFVLLLAVLVLPVLADGETTAPTTEATTAPTTEATTEATTEETTVPEADLSLNITSLTIDAAGETLSETLVATIGAGNPTKTVKWKSANAKIAAVDQKGKVTAKALGKTVITATAGKVSVSCEVTVLCNHKLTKVEAKPATCQESGNNEYYICEAKLCKQLFKDSAGKIETILEYETLEKLPCSDGTLSGAQHGICLMCGNPYGSDATDHIWAPFYYGDETEHWYSCEVPGCTAVMDKAPHQGEPATCDKKSVCTICQREYGQQPPHKFTISQQDEAFHWYQCADCGTTTEKESHIFDQKMYSAAALKSPADCANDAVYYYSCVCGQVGTEAFFTDEGSSTGLHTDADDLWESDGVTHWHTCACGTVIDEALHTGGKATCKEKAVCYECNAVYGEEDAGNHTDGIEVRDVFDGGCAVEGYTGNAYCVGCGDLVAEGLPISKIPHLVKEWTTVKNATVDATGEKVGVCTGCGTTITVATGKLVTEMQKENVQGIGMAVTTDGNANISENMIFRVTEVSNILSEDDRTAIEALILSKNGRDTMAAIFDLALYTNEKATSGDALESIEVSLEGEATVTLSIPASLPYEYAGLRLVRINPDGTATTVSYTMVADWIQFRTDSFGYYALVGIANADTSDVDGMSPAVLAVTIAVLVGVCGAEIYVLYFKKEKKQEN